MSEQQAVVCLGDSERADFPLVLIFGREYNNEIENTVVNRLGSYNFKDSPYSGFWNKSYGFIGRICRRADFKAQCIRSNQSPVLFSNALPSPIPNKYTPAAKRKRRLAIPKEKIRRYVGGLFEIPIIKRVCFIVLSGLEDQEAFGVATQYIKKECQQRQITVVEVPYFVSHIKKGLFDEAISESNRSEICHSIEAFYQGISREVHQ